MATATRKTPERREQDVRTRRAVRPLSNICQEEDGKVVLRVEMPGVSKDQVDVQMENDTLTIRGERDVTEGSNYLVRERRVAPFERIYTLDESIDRENIDAHMEHGVLTLTLHMREQVQPRKIEIKGG